MAISTGGVSIPGLGSSIDTSLYGNQYKAQIEPVKGMSLSDMVNMSRGATQLKKEQALLESDIAKGKSESQIQQYNAEKTRVELQRYYQNIVRGTLGGLITDPDFVTGNKEGMKKKIEQTKEYLHSIGVPEFDKGSQHKALLEMIDKDPKAATQFIKNGIQQAGSNAEQFGEVNKTPAAVSTGQGVQFVPTSPYQGANQNQFVQQQLAPSTELVAQPGDNTGLPPGTKYLLGPNKQPMPVTGLAPQVSGMINTQGQGLAADFGDIQKTAGNSEFRVGLFQNIKKLSSESFTGVGGSRKELASGILNAVGIPLYEAEKMSTDELAKSSAMLALAGGNTDAARALAEAANPNKKMNAGAIREISDQMIGMERLNQAKYNFLKPVANDPVAYQNKLAQFNQVNDFRIFQESTPEQVKKLKESMSPAEQQKMGEKIKIARQLGIL